MTTTLDISTGAIVRRLTFAVAILALLTLAYYAREALSIMAVAAFIALAVNKPVAKLENNLPIGGRKLAAMVVFLLVGAVVASVIALIIPLALNEGRELATAIPAYIQQLQAGDTFISRIILRFDILVHLETVATNFVNGLISSTGVLIDFAARILSNAAVFVFTIVLSFLMVVEGRGWLDLMRKLFPETLRQHVGNISDKVYSAVSGFVNGQLIITSIAALSTLVVLTVAGMPAPLSLAAVIWMTGLIPLVGNTLGAVVVIAVALSQSLLLAVFLSVYYVIYQQVENNVFEPIIQSRTIRMTPLMVLLSALIGVHLAGFLGALLAIPAGASVKLIINYAINLKASDDSLTQTPDS